MISPVGILEYGCGNIRSVKNALTKIGVSSTKIIQNEADLFSVDKIILPGVGAFDSGCLALKEMRFSDALKRYLADKKNKALGICLGMQLLCYSSEEGNSNGLGLVNAVVTRMDHEKTIKVPHMGWNTVLFSYEDPLLKDLGKEQDFYFVHSYQVNLKDCGMELGLTYHGKEFTSMYRSENIWGVQFHPEKSQAAGLTILSNFIRHA